MNNYMSSNTSSFYAMSWISFVVSFGGGLLGIWFMEADMATKGFFAMTFLFAVSSCFTLAKAVRDKHEENQIISKVEKAKTEKLLTEFKEIS